MAEALGAVLAKARSSEPRRFASLAAALNVLRDVGITVGKFDASEWNPTKREPAKRIENRGQALRKAHEAAAYNEWLAAEIQEAIDDPRPSLPHDEVMSRMDARIARQCRFFLGLVNMTQENFEDTGIHRTTYCHRGSKSA